MVQQINENMIREAAYFLWEKAGRPDGSAEFFWMKACEQFFKPTKVAIKKPVKKAVKPSPKKEVKSPAPKAPVKKVTAPVKAVVKTVAKAPVKVAAKVVAKPVVKGNKKSSAPVFYGARK